MEFFQKTSISQSKRWNNKTNVIKFKIKLRKTAWQFIKRLKIELPYDKSKLSVTQSCLTLCYPMNCSLSGPSFHGILQARILEWLHLKQLEKEEMKNPRVSRRKEILKLRAEINAKETKETIFLVAGVMFITAHVASLACSMLLHFSLCFMLDHTR